MGSPLVTCAPHAPLREDAELKGRIATSTSVVVGPEDSFARATL